MLNQWDCLHIEIHSGNNLPILAGQEQFVRMLWLNLAIPSEQRCRGEGIEFSIQESVLHRVWMRGEWTCSSGAVRNSMWWRGEDNGRTIHLGQGVSNPTRQGTNTPSLLQALVWNSQTGFTHSMHKKLVGDVGDGVGVGGRTQAFIAKFRVRSWVAIA